MLFCAPRLLRPPSPSRTGFATGLRDLCGKPSAGPAATGLAETLFKRFLTILFREMITPSQ